MLLQRRYTALLLISLMISVAVGCSALNEDPIIDQRGINQAQYQQDLLECRSYADEVDASGAVLGGAAGGAVIGGAVGAVIGDSDTAKRGAGAGAIAGGVKGGLRTMERKQRIVRRCLQGRGYRVLG